MARDLHAEVNDAAEPWIVADGRESAEGRPGGDVTGQDAENADSRPDLRVVGPPADGDGSGELARTASLQAPMDEEEDPGARVFLEMVDRADTVRALPSQDSAPEPALADWLWSVGEGETPAAETLLSTIEQAMWHVNHSDDIRNEELRGRLLDLFTDFAVRRPWKDEERPEAQRIQRLMEQAGGEGPDEPLRRPDPIGPGGAGAAGRQRAVRARPLTVGRECLAGRLFGGQLDPVGGDGALAPANRHADDECDGDRKADPAEQYEQQHVWSPSRSLVGLGVDGARSWLDRPMGVVRE
jgi:hypothetical protein